MHGGPGSTHYGVEPLKALPDDRCVVFYDQLGCGESDRLDDVTLWRTERFVEELHELRQFLRLDRVHVLGYSWSTMLAMDYYLAHPEGISSLVMSSPCINIPRWLEDCAGYRRQLPTQFQEALDRYEKAKITDSDEYKAATEEFNRRHVHRMDPSARSDGACSRGSRTRRL